MMSPERSCGVLLHITSLPGKHGTGTIGDEAYSFIDLLSRNGITYWQILPIGPVSESMYWSPYSSLSSFAGNEIFISTDRLRECVWFDADIPLPEIPENSHSDFTAAKEYTLKFLETAEKAFRNNSSAADKKTYDLFREEHGDRWLNDYALYMALSEKFGTNDWQKWDKKAALRDEAILASLKTELDERIELYRFAQFIFFTQWNELKDYAKIKNIKIIGDIPIYMSMDSSDSWVSKNIIEIDTDTLKPSFVAGVPPDYFSKTGQLWGNPVYKWHKNDGITLSEETYRWWLNRIRHSLTLADVIRIDHFRGFESFWSVPYGEDTAVNGEWVKGPGKKFFNRLKNDLEELAIIAEDLGDITSEVKKLRDDLSLPGMKILLFAFDQNNKNEYLPHNITDRNCIVYTGTHDNDTANGWFYNPEMFENDRNYIMEYLSMKDWSDFHMRIIREAMATIADLVIIPAQDILGFGNEFRMNTPGTVRNNWLWKLREGELNDEIMGKIKRMAYIFSRIPEVTEED